MTAESELESTVLLRTHDQVRARMVRALLETEGIAVSTPGLEHHSLMPHVGAAIAIVVRVPARDLERARVLVQEMEREVEEEPVPSENAPYREAAKKKAPTLSPRLKRIAVVASFIVPGGAHFYVQRPMLAFAVIGGYAAAIASMIAWVPYSGYALAVIWVGDVLGGLEGCDVAQGRPGSVWRKNASLGAVALVVAWAFLARGPLLPTLAGSAAAVWCEYEGRCGGRTEQACLLDAVMGSYAEPEGACTACLRSERTCEAIEAQCATVCWPESEGGSGLGGDPSQLVY